MSAFEDTYKTGTTLGVYQVIGRLGKGGMATVYRGRHPDTGVEYALKVLERGADEEDIARFQREGEAMARVDAHPNVVRVHSAGREGERRYLVMDLAAGGNLREKLRAGPLPPDEVARIVRDLARGLEHAHKHGVLHRDLKPANVLFDESGTPRLTDFGLAKMTDSQSLTATGVVLGSPAYLAPEQALSGTADERTDVFGLGAILFHALCGQSPHTGSTVLEVVTSAIEGVKRGPAAVEPDVPTGLDRITRKALARDPAARYPSAQALGAALDRFLEGEPEEVDPAERRRLLLAVGLFGVLLLSVAAVGVVALTRKEPKPSEVVAKTATKTDRTPPQAAESLELRVRALLERDPVKALKLLNTSARGGDLEAKRYLAHVYLSSSLARRFGVRLNPRRSIDLLTELLEADKPVWRELSDAWETWAKNASPNDHVQRKKKALEWLRIGSQAGDPACTFRYAERLIKNPEELGTYLKGLATAERALTKVIETGKDAARVKAMVLLGDLITAPHPNRKPDVARARKLYEEAALLGSQRAREQLERLAALKGGGE